MYPVIKANKAMPTTRLLKIKEAAAYLAISDRTLWTLIRYNKLPCVRFGKIVRIDRNDLDTFIQTMKGC